MRVINGARWTPAERPLPPPPTRTLPTRVTVAVDEAVFSSAVDGQKELCLPGIGAVSVGDTVHLVENTGAGTATGRCCSRLVTRCPGGGNVTVLGAKGQCEGRHG